MRRRLERRRSSGRGAWSLLGALVLSLASAAAVADAPPLGFADRSPTVDPARDTLFADAVGWPDPRIGRWEARQADARVRAASRAREALHAHVDARLARCGATPRAAAAVHATLEAAVVEVERRPLVDGGAVIRLEAPLAAVREAARPWELEL